MIKGSVYQADVMILRELAPDERASKIHENKLLKLKGEKDKCTIILGNVNTHPSVKDDRQKNCYDIDKISNTTNQLGPNDIYRWCRQLCTLVEYTFFSRTHGLCIKKDHIVAQKTSLSKFKDIKIIQTMFSDHHGIKLELVTER